MTPKGWEGGRLCAKVRHLPLEGFPSQKGAGSRGTQPSPAEKLHRGGMARSGSVAPSRGTSPGQATLHSSCRAGRATKYQLGSGRHIQTISSPSQTRGWAPKARRGQRGAGVHPQAPSQEQTQRLSPRTKSQRGFGVQQLTSSSCPGPTQDLHVLALPLHPLQTVWPRGFGTAAPPRAARPLCTSAERAGRCSGVPARAHRGDVLGEKPAPEVQLTLQKDPQVNKDSTPGLCPRQRGFWVPLPSP